MQTFTIRQAESLLPLLSRELTVLQPTYQQLRELWEAAAKKHGLHVYDPRVKEVSMNDDQILPLIEKVEKSLQLFFELGIECKGIEDGLIDFPCLLEDRLVYLCWKFGEPSIAHWHELDAGFAGRRSLFEATARERTLEHYPI